MRLSESEVIEFIRDNDVKFIKLAFCDIYGRQKIVSVQPPVMKQAFNGGVPVQASQIDGYSWYHGDLFLVPDTSTMCLLPWRPSHGRVVRFFCDILTAEGKPFDADPRSVLRTACGFAAKSKVGIDFESGSEFYLFRNNDDGYPTEIPFDNAGYMDAAPDDKGEDVRREICLTLEDMGVTPMLSHHNAGPGQNEVNFLGGEALSAADNVLTYRSVVKTMAERNGLYASFSPKPIPNKNGSRFRVSVTPRFNGSDCSEAFLSGLISKIKEITAFFNPSESSYERFGFFGAPKDIIWKKGSKDPLFILDEDSGRIDILSPDASANPYLVYALIIYAGISGVNDDMKLASSEEGGSLPGSLMEARKLCAKSEFVKKILPKSIVSEYIYGNVQ